MEQFIELADNARFMGLLNPDRYQAYLHPDADFEQLRNHLYQESAQGHVLLWGTSLPNHWTVRISDHPSATEAERDVLGVLLVTQEVLYLVNYQHLLDAAQYDDPFEVPARQAYRIAVPNGAYRIHVRQLFHAEHDAVHEEDLGFEVVLKRLSKPPSPPLNEDWRPMPWSVYD